MNEFKNKKRLMKEKMNNSIQDVKKPLELMEIYNNEPEPVFYWRGIEDVSFGFFFGPSKAGKSIFSENLAISLAVGKSTFFNSELVGKPKKVFLAALEEDYRNRTRRMQKQMINLSHEECKLFNENMTYSGKDFPRFLTTQNQWLEFESLVKDLKPDVIILDSLTRIVEADITNRDVCKDVLSRLRNFAYDQGLCLILIHHATKNAGKPLTMDSMAGSSVLSQEADFSIGINRNEMTNQRYLKEVFYRYAESNDMVTQFTIDNDTNWLIPKASVHESKIVYNIGEDLGNNYELIVNYLEDKAEQLLMENEDLERFEITVSELKKEFVSSDTMKPRTFDYTLDNIKKNNILIPKGKMGNYVYNISFTQDVQHSQD